MKENAERFMKTIKNKIYEYMTSISKNVFIDKLDDLVNKYNNTYHRTTKMKPVDVKSSTYIVFNNENDNKCPKFKVGDYVRISKHKNIVVKNKIWGKDKKRFEELFLLTKEKIMLRRHISS